MVSRHKGRSGYGSGHTGNVSLVSGMAPSFSRIEDPVKGDLSETFIDRYRAWGSTVTDAPPQYHTVNGVVILSTIMAPHAILRANHAIIRPNIWAMILAGTTLTRKSTTMDMAKSLLNDLGLDYLMGTDGSPEGIMSEMHDRDGKVSLFHRDEITGWIESTKKDYMAGLLQSFTRFYDCQEEKRVLRSGTVIVKEPRLVIMSGGIKQEMEHLITLEHINSGFLPRFIMISGTTSLEKIRPFGPPTNDKGGHDLRDDILEELREINDFWTPAPTTTTVQTTLGTKTILSHPSASEMKATPDAWTRIALLKEDAYALGARSLNDQLYTPILDRLSNSVIKTAMLIAGARRSTDIKYEDVIQAIRYGNAWLTTMMKFAEAVESSPDMTMWERKVDKIIKYMRVVRDNEDRPVTRSEIERRFRISSKHIGDIETTMTHRGYIDVKAVPSKSRSGKPRVEYTLVDDPFTTPSPISGTRASDSEREWG